MQDFSVRGPQMFEAPCSGDRTKLTIRKSHEICENFPKIAVKLLKYEKLLRKFQKIAKNFTLWAQYGENSNYYIYTEFLSKIAEVKEFFKYLTEFCSQFVQNHENIQNYYLALTQRLLGSFRKASPCNLNFPPNASTGTRFSGKLNDLT